MNPQMQFLVIVSRPGIGRFTGGTYDLVAKFRNERKARDYYTDMLLKYPNYEVKFEIIKDQLRRTNKCTLKI